MYISKHMSIMLFHTSASFHTLKKIKSIIAFVIETESVVIYKAAVVLQYYSPSCFIKARGRMILADTMMTR